MFFKKQQETKLEIHFSNFQNCHKFWPKKKREQIGLKKIEPSQVMYKIYLGIFLTLIILFS